MATILEALQNANINLTVNRGNLFAHEVAVQQVHNAVELLEKGYGLHDEVEPLIDEYGTVENVPEHTGPERRDKEKPIEKPDHAGPVKQPDDSGPQKQPEEVKPQ